MSKAAIDLPSAWTVEERRSAGINLEQGSSSGDVQASSPSTAMVRLAKQEAQIAAPGGDETPPDTPLDEARDAAASAPAPSGDDPGDDPGMISPQLRATLLDVAYCALWNVIYFGTGAAFYMTQQGWNAWESFYFLMATASTVGYGDLNPDASVPGSRVFTLVYIIFGIGVVFSQTSALISRAIKPLYVWARDLLDRVFPEKAVDIDGDGEADFFVPKKPLLYYSKNLIAPFFVIMSFQCFFAAIFCTLEDWDYGTALYHCLVTMTTVGFGDVMITNDGARM